MAGPIPVHTLADAFAISRPAISRHLRVLKSAGLVAEVKKGRENLYALKPTRLSGAIKWLNSVAQREAEADHGQEEPLQPASAERSKQSLTTPSRARPQERSQSKTGILEVKGEAEEPPLFAPKVEKAARDARQAPVNQMGFDF